jgi:hypothetical protein
MRTTAITGPLLMGLALSISAGGCTSEDPAQFQSNFDEAVKAAAKGKQALKDAKKHRPAKPTQPGPQAPGLEPHGLPDVS